MHICMITGDAIGGIRRHIHDIVNGLAGEFSFSYIIGSSSLNEAAFNHEIEHIKTLINGRFAVIGITKAPSINDVMNIAKCIMLIKSWRCDAVHGHGAKGGFYARLVGAALGIRVIYTPHGGSLHNIYGGLMGSIYLFAERLMSLVTDVVIFESSYSLNIYKSKITKKNKPRLVVNKNSVPRPERGAEIQVEETGIIRFGIFGVIRPVKGQRVALEAFRRILGGTTQNIELHFFGDGDEKTILMKESGTLLDRKVFFHGVVVDVTKWMEKMDSIILPSLAESLPYVALEAIALQRYLIGTKVGALGELVTDSQMGVLLPPGDIDCLVRTVECYVANPKRPPPPSFDFWDEYGLESFLLKAKMCYQLPN